jgi:ABC-type Fe3+-hydroxamate transport system substrate-binding protein
MLIECGVNVVGRTRFCVHPKDSVSSIKIVGGTKDLDWEKVKALEADLLILDQEENPLWMAEQAPIPAVITHVTSVQNVAQEIRKFSKAGPACAQQLEAVASRWETIASKSGTWDWEKIPGEIESIRRDHKSYKKLVYVIWEKPWMAVSKQTFIGSVLDQLGAETFLFEFEKKYPEFQLEDFNLAETYFLFSSEPYPFHRKIQNLRELNVQGSIVDGECFSWFGTRSLRFLESEFKR